MIKGSTVTSKRLVSNSHTGVNIEWKSTLEEYLWLFYPFFLKCECIIFFVYIKDYFNVATEHDCIL